MASATRPTYLERHGSIHQARDIDLAPRAAHEQLARRAEIRYGGLCTTPFMEFPA